MTREEVDRYINQIAFSGAREFLDLYTKDASLIGRFGLGFYSAFMVSKSVEIDTLSWQPDSVPCKWSCDGGTKARISKGERKTPGTSVTCFLAHDSVEFLDVDRVESIVRTYLDYAPYPIQVAGRQANICTAPWHLNATERELLPDDRFQIGRASCRERV